MKTTDEMKVLCCDAGHGIKKTIADGVDLAEHFEGGNADVPILGGQRRR